MLGSHQGLLVIPDVRRFELIGEKFNQRPHSFQFPASMVKSILPAIKTKAMDFIKATNLSYNNGPSISGSLFGSHPRVQQVAGKLFEDGHYRSAILDTYIALVEQVKIESGRYDLDGSALMQHVFSPKSPKIIISDDPDEQMGVMWMFSGAVMGIRNPKAH